MLDCVALLTLELLPSFVEAAAAPELTAFERSEASTQLLCLLCLLLHTERTRALAVSRGADAKLSRALAGSLVSI